MVGRIDMPCTVRHQLYLSTWHIENKKAVGARPHQKCSQRQWTTEEQVSLLTPSVIKMTPYSIEERQKFLQGHGGRRRDGHKPATTSRRTNPKKTNTQDTDDTSSVQVCDVSRPEQVLVVTYHVQQSLQLTNSEPYQLVSVSCGMSESE